MSAPEVSVVIAAYQAERTLPALLAALDRQDASFPFEVIVVDDGSRDATAAVAERAGARVVRQDNAGPAAARNRGWREAAADVVLFTDSDCVPHPDWVRRLREAIDDEFAVAGGTYDIANRGHLLAETVHAEILWRHSRLPDAPEFAGSFNLAVTRAALEAVGGFDENYPAASGEDNDLSYRLRDAGYRIRFARGAAVAHHHPVRLGRYLSEQRRHGFWRMFLYARHPGRARGDGYAGPADFAAPPLAMSSVALLLVAPWAPRAYGAAALCVAAVLFLQSVLAVRVAAFCRSTVPLALAPIGALRAYARGFGMAAGLLRVILSKVLGR